MTEKQYGGATGRGTDKTQKANQNKPIKKIRGKMTSQETAGVIDLDNSSKEIDSKSNYIKAGKIAKEVVDYAKSIIKPNMPLLEIAEKIEAKIIELKAKPAFPVNLSINEIAAHDTPAFNDARKASGLLKVDIGVHIDGCIADTAFSLDLENSAENKKLIEASEFAVKNACEKILLNIKTDEIGGAIEKAITSCGFTPIHNLSGHSIEQYELHSGLTIPNYKTANSEIIERGIYAIEPFATSGEGAVKDGKLSGIYRIEKDGNVRDSLGREILDFIAEEYKTLPFCSRWLCKKFGARALISLKRIEEAGLLHHYPQLVERSGKKVSQAEHTVLIEDSKKIITTL